MAQTTSAAEAANYLHVRNDWLARRKEPILEPDLPIIDPHHHLWDRENWRYLLDDLLADTNSGHNIIATVFVQARAMLRADGLDEMKPVGETEFVNGVAAMTASGIYGKIRACAGIVSHADMMLGSRVEPVLEAHERAGGGRFRGIRHITAYDADPQVMNPGNPAWAGMLADAKFREGVKTLARWATRSIAGFIIRRWKI
jgi:predicted TIM-barrel fold metal-dependent hydrolase